MEKGRKKIIFLLSQPRSGSTLLQKILGSHSQVFTKSEPWIMLPQAYMLKDEGIYSEFDFNMYRRGINDFILSMPGGRSDFIKEIRKMNLAIYKKFMKNEKIFIDKTPRYYLIIEELMEIFPEAKFIIILRNPLAVLTSIITNWTKSNWFRLSEYKQDLIRGVEVLDKFIRKSEPNVHFIKFEDLLKNGSQAVKEICDFIGVKYEKGMMNFSGLNEKKWELGDQKIYSTTSIEGSIADDWMNEVKNPQIWRVLSDYFLHIGRFRFEKLGYDFNYFEEFLLKTKPYSDNKELNYRTFGLFSFLENTKDCLIENFRLKNQVRENSRLLSKSNNEQLNLEKNENKKEVSIVIGSFNRLFFLQKTIQGVRNELKKMDIRSEIIVVDGGSTDGTMGWLIRQKDIITIIQHNKGYLREKRINKRSWGYFMNLGFKSAQGKYICMLSDDALIIPGAIINGYKYFEAGLKSGKKLGALAFYFRDYPVRKKYGVAINLGKLYVNHGLFLRKALNEVGYISEDEYEFYFADTDLVLKLNQLGYYCEISENSYVEHFFNANKTLRTDNNNEAKVKDRSTLINKWAGIAFPDEEKSHFTKSVGYWKYTDYKDNLNTIDELLEADKKYKT